MFVCAALIRSLHRCCDDNRTTGQQDKKDDRFPQTKTHAGVHFAPSQFSNFPASNMFSSQPGPASLSPPSPYDKPREAVQIQTASKTHNTPNAPAFKRRPISVCVRAFGDTATRLCFGASADGTQTISDSEGSSDVEDDEDCAATISATVSLTLALVSTTSIPTANTRWITDSVDALLKADADHDDDDNEDDTDDVHEAGAGAGTGTGTGSSSALTAPFSLHVSFVPALTRAGTTCLKCTRSGKLCAQHDVVVGAGVTTRTKTGIVRNATSTSALALRTNVNTNVNVNVKPFPARTKAGGLCKKCEAKGSFCHLHL